HQGAYFPGNLDASVGNFPVTNPIATMGTVALFKNDFSFTVRLVDPNGAAVSGVACTARVQAKYFTYSYFNSNGNLLVSAGTYTIKATSDMNGLVTFAGMPSLQALAMINAQYG